jgi:hypothetical protein
MSRMPLLSTLAFTIVCAGCDDGPTRPSSRAIVTFAVANERFRVSLESDEELAAARAAQAGGAARIPIGRIAAGTDVNSGWTWHLEGVTFAEVTTELCDGRPSDVERLGAAFGGGRYCPWAASIVDIDPR